MSVQQSLQLDVTSIDLARFVDFNPIPDPQRRRVAGMGRRGQQVGTEVGIIALRHSAGYEVVLQFADGKLDSFNPHELFPVLEGEEV